MTAVFMEGFDRYGTGSQSVTNINYNRSASPMGPSIGIGAPTGGTRNPAVYCGVPDWGPAATGPYCLVGGWGVSYGIQSIVSGNVNFLAAPIAQSYISCHFACDALPLNDYSMYIFGFGQGVGAYSAISLGITSDGRVALYSASGGGGTPTVNLIASSAAGLITPQQFHLLEILVDTTNNLITVKVDDPILTKPISAVVSSTGLIGSLDVLNIFPGYKSVQGGVTITNAAPGGVYIDDLFIRDSTGSTNNGWLGDRRVLWCPVTTNTVGTVVAPNTATYSLPTIPSNTTQISAVQLVQPYYIVIGTGTSGTEKATLTTALGNTVSGTTHNTSNTITDFNDVINIDPDTSLPFIPGSLVNGKITIALT